MKILWYKKIKFDKRQLVKYGALGLSGLVILLLLVFAAYSIIYNNKTYLNQYIGGYRIGGLTKPELRKFLEDKSTLFMSQTIKLEDTGSKKIYEIDPTEVGLNFDLDKTTENIWRLGRNESAKVAFFEQLASLLWRHQHQAYYLINEEGLKQKIAEIGTELDQPEQDYSLAYREGKFELTTERKEGKRIDQSSMIAEAKNHISKLNSATIQFALNVYTPHVDKQKAEARLLEANKILDGGILTLAFENQKFEVDTETIGGFIKSRPNGDDLELIFNDDRLKKYMEILAKSIDVTPANAKLTITGNRANVFQASRAGKVLDQAESIAKLKGALLARISGSPGQVALSVKIQKPEVSEEDINSLGIIELIGSAMTDFKGSPANRIHNITVGASGMNGVILKPGETFSTLGHLGTIDASTGYLEELVIRENRTVPEFGGGLCQVSTTIFRAALNAGMKITERAAHKYRVGYFEPLVGMDATIYDPAPDFKFINNYASHILIQSKIEGTKITFEMYGTKDGRNIQLDAPKVYDYTSPSEPVMIETDTLAPGEKKQIEKAHNGATASVYYKVTSEKGEVLQEKTFISKYVPWPEKWLVGKAAAPAAPVPVPVTPAPTCTDAQQNGDETGVDCGGSCPSQCSQPI